MGKISISKKMNLIVATALGSANDINKEYLNETISSTQKKEQLASIVGIAELRIQEALRTAFLNMVGDMRTSKVNPVAIEQVKDIMNDYL
jgi:hypothetical protein